MKTNGQIVKPLRFPSLTLHTSGALKVTRLKISWFLQDFLLLVLSAWLVADIDHLEYQYLSEERDFLLSGLMVYVNM